MWTLRIALACVVLTLGCGKSAEERARDVGICSDTADAGRIAACLRGRGWDAAPADSAAGRSAAVLDSVYRRQLDSVWRVDTVSHASVLARCADRGGDVASCLLLAGWPPERATATAESLWNTEADLHQQQVGQCVRGSAGGNIADCLMLYHKWHVTRALAANDSVQRLRLPGRRP